MTMNPAIDEIPLAQPVLGREEEDLVLEVLRSGSLSLGPTGPRFERDFAQFVGAPHASAVSSGTAGLHLAIRAAGVTDGDDARPHRLVRRDEHLGDDRRGAERHRR
ncbi:MAG: Glutamine--scyllo-inositol transaminase, partial [Solirubrobacterales bacterium]|nr:Glutamine--scyllo-inositol transaminase [Solirubrobacterales bacterium]